MIQGNILYCGVHKIKTFPDDSMDFSEEIKENLLISTDSNHNGYYRNHCLLDVSSASISVMSLPKIHQVEHFHQINASHILAIPSNQHCLHIYERIINDLTLKDIIGNCSTRGRRKGPQPLFSFPSQSLSDNRNRQIVYVIDQSNTEIRAINTVEWTDDTIFISTDGHSYYFEDSIYADIHHFWHITQAENSSFYISVTYHLHNAPGKQIVTKNTIVKMDLEIPTSPKSYYDGSTPFMKTINQYSIEWEMLMFESSNSSNSSTDSKLSFERIEQITLLTNKMLMFREKTGNGIRVLDLLERKIGYIDQMDLQPTVWWVACESKPLFYTWIQDTIVIRLGMQLVKLTLQQLLHHNLEVISSSFDWKTSKYQILILIRNQVRWVSLSHGDSSSSPITMCFHIANRAWNWLSQTADVNIG